MFDKHKRAAQLACEPYICISAARGFADGETIPFADTDWTSETLVCSISTAPGQERLTMLPVSLTVEQKTWQQYKDECIPVERFMPCDADLADVITTTLMTISWTPTSLETLPRASILGEPVNLYLEIHRSDNTGRRFVSGDFILTERIV